MLRIFICFGIVAIAALIKPVRNGSVKEIAIICVVIAIGLYYGICFINGEQAWSPLNALESWMLNETPIHYDM
jgi:hypothetical protein